ncbi:threonine/serine exporter ThrE family protein [Flammeovirga sp. EKP202]|uniref:threonine/serine ThrE exporter family protein n=1 Tax=Flammeovirga sp. EKP202 TaxID=2770592 RepID=UPI00165F779E|nr:threonine/serine exporter family protein [Flammeovirga sp. EKP202]MBD0401529.1 threonine/serine exporter family protein [Flammeovirga sp. EKP202]
MKTNTLITKTIHFEQACQFIKEVGKRAHRYGSTSIRLEMYLRELTESLGYQGTFRSSPTEILFSFNENKDSTPQMYIEEVDPTDFNLHRLSLLQKLVNKVIHQGMTLDTAMLQLEEIEKEKQPWGIMALALSFMIAGGGFAMMISGSLADVMLSTFLGLVVFLLQPLISYFGGEKSSEWSPFVTAFVVGSMTAIAKTFWVEINLITTTVSALIILIPGFVISVGIMELFYNHIVSGMANVANGLLYLVKLFAGTWLGILLVNVFVELPQGVEGNAVNPMWLLLFLPIVLLALCAVFQISKKNIIVVSSICLSSLIGMIGGSLFLDVNFGNFLGTVFLVVLSNWWGNKSGEPSSIPLLPSMMLVVSGSIGFRGLAYLTSGQIDIGQQDFAQMFVVALTMGAGFLVGNMIVKEHPSL